MRADYHNSQNPEQVSHRLRVAGDASRQCKGAVPLRISWASGNLASPSMVDIQERRIRKVAADQGSVKVSETKAPHLTWPCEIGQVPNPTDPLKLMSTRKGFT